MFKWLYGSVLYSKSDRLGTYAAALAYCVVLSLVPFLVLTFAVGFQIASQLSMQDDYENAYAQVLRDVLPMENRADTARILKVIIPDKKIQENPSVIKMEKKAQEQAVEKKSWIAVYIGLGLAIYTSFNLMDQITRTLLFIFDDPRKPSQWTLRMMGKTFLLLLIWMCLLLLLSISALEISVLRNLLDQSVLSALSKAVAKAAQVLIVVGALVGTLFLTYDLIPAKNYKRRLVLEGAMLASTGWVACSLVFASLVPKLLQTSATYVALGSVVAILLWAQACAWSIVVGACWIVRFSAKK